ncbi:hypothetical protein FGIG_00644 [Fasciola gigantica]|uniref:Saposin B-type domain-containing protein n=1 Tax=Fasciola gigantica TaxID=46835 RepID=A0A504YLI4_FASGI|nr:hypothetical protein FGIG_00644 [Fasciola gigantica]
MTDQRVFFFVMIWSLLNLVPFAKDCSYIFTETAEVLFSVTFKHSCGVPIVLPVEYSILDAINKCNVCVGCAEEFYAKSEAIRNSYIKCKELNDFDSFLRKLECF